MIVQDLASLYVPAEMKTRSFTDLQLSLNEDLGDPEVLMQAPNIKEHNSWWIHSWISFILSRTGVPCYCICALFTIWFDWLNWFNSSRLTLSLTFTPAAEVALRRVTYEEMLEDWFSLSEEPATPGGKPAHIKAMFSTRQCSQKNLWVELMQWAATALKKIRLYWLCHPHTSAR